MQTFTVHEPPSPAADRVDRAESLVFIKEGFSWGAALFGPFWLLAHRLWWPLVGYVVAYGAIEAVRLARLIDQRWIGLVVFALNLLLAFEGDSLRRWALDRRGWRLLGAANGRNRAECERRFFDAWLPAQPVLQAPAAAGGAGRRDWPVIGSILGARG
ncbi:MAG TPA: DUF2628 domain-containing protein [Hyphomicrobiaceae bacterium]|jgi:hypothetical protein|nr:DUF2628 domain-containing protein [Hyphomicrobiaceae bacterium]